MLGNGYPSAPWSYPQSNTFTNYTQPYANGSGYIPGQQYNVTLTPQMWPDGNGTSIDLNGLVMPKNAPSTCNVLGYTKPIGKSYCTSGS